MIVVFGGLSQLAQQIAINCIAHRDEVEILPHVGFDVTNDQEIKQAFDRYKPSIVINCAAMNDVDNIENFGEASGKAARVNHDGARIVAAQSQSHGVHCIHISTDHVFGHPDSRLARKETDITHPVSRYAQTKKNGEVEALKYGASIIRTCGIYGGDSSSSCLKWILKRDPIYAVSDQFCTPTYVVDLARAALNIAKLTRGGEVWHVTNGGACSWFEFASFARHYFGIPSPSGVTTEFWADYSLEKTGIHVAPRPVSSVLCNEKYKKEFGEALRPWRTAVEECISRLA